MQASNASWNASLTADSESLGMLQVADGALSQVTNLLDRAITLATEASNGTLNSSQDSAANEEYQSILAEVTNIGNTNYNQSSIFGTDTPSTSGTSTIGSVPGTSDNLGNTNLTDRANAEAALTEISGAISDVAKEGGYYGSWINGTTSFDSVVKTQVQNTTAALNSIQATDYATTTSDLSKNEILLQTGISALAQSNKMQNEEIEDLQKSYSGGQ
jgi:flagellin